MKTPKSREFQRRQVENKICSQGRRSETGLSIKKVEQGGKGQIRMAVVGIGKSDFSNPAVAAHVALKSLFDPNLEPEPVTYVDPSTLTCRSPSEATFRKHSFMSTKAFIRRMKLIARDEKYLRAWKSKHKYGMFFLYADRLVLQTWTPQEGFQVQRVPEDGLPCIPAQRRIDLIRAKTLRRKGEL
jgi:hypothetical protein